MPKRLVWLRETASPSAPLAKRLRLRPKSVLLAVSERHGGLERKAARALQGVSEPNGLRASSAEADIA